MWQLFFLHTVRYAARHRTMSLLNVVGIALGVMVFLSIQVVNHSALQSFRAAVDIVAGKANLQVVGDGLRFDEQAFVAVRNNADVAAATPLVEEIATLTDHPGEYLHILGIDVFSNGPLTTFTLAKGDNDPTAALGKQADILDFFTDPRTIAITDGMARKLKLSLGDFLTVDTQTGPVQFRVGSVIKFGPDAAGADDHLAVMDIANVQENFLHVGKLSEISIMVRPGIDPNKVAAELAPQMPGNALVRVPDRRNGQVERMIGAFQLNLTALSMISLLVGMFLIYNTVSTAVVGRRYEIGVLKALGLSSLQVQCLFIGEALVLGIVGLILGVVLGVLLAGQLIGLVSKTITSLYILASIQELFVSPWALFSSAFLGLGAVFLAAWWPSREAAELPPVEALQVGHLQDKVAGQTWVWTTLGLALLVVAALCAWISLKIGVAWVSFGSALTTLLGFSLFVPLACQLLVKAMLWFSQAGGQDRVFLRLATGQFSRSLHRNAVTIAAMVTSLAMVVGISTMIFSFRTTVESWLNRSIQADLLIAPAANLLLGNRELVRPDAEHAVDDLAQTWNAKTPGNTSAKVDKFRELRLRLGTEGDEIKLVTYHMKITRGMDRLSYIQGDEESAIGGAIDQEATVISESLSRKHHLNLGDFVEVNTPMGRHSFKIGGVYRDYTTESGVMLLDWDVYQKYWQDAGVNGMAIYLPPGADLAERQHAVEDTLRPFGDYMVKSNRELRTQVFLIFDQTFSVTYVLQIIGVIVSTLGIFLSLTILVTERRREISILRATGASQAQIMRLILIEAAMIGIVGSVLGLMAGLVLAKILSDVINVAFFGWTITWATPWLFLMLLPLVVIGSSLLAGYGPARQAARLNIANGLKME